MIQDSKILPQVIILSTQRSGTHLLLSFLNKHPKINGRGEIFHKYHSTGTIEDNLVGKVNVAILMYKHVKFFYQLGGDFKNHKIIHLLRSPQKVALSCLQMDEDRKLMGDKYKAHYHKNELSEVEYKNLLDRKAPDLSTLEKKTDEITKLQNYYIEKIKYIPHLQLNYEEFVPNNESVLYLNDNVQNKLLDFLQLEKLSFPLFTTYLKTGINI